jgi:hypothetical protein
VTTESAAAYQRELELAHREAVARAAHRAWTRWLRAKELRAQSERYRCPPDDWRRMLPIGIRRDPLLPEVCALLRIPLP